ncbi:cbb3-type cytochrome oxidase assembly protein CcoS [Hoeflea sp. YIM 152468]|uniref:cbb3-type cytochrome oxidase assembly protein CcoS n=1 Tax=Hoeflea sp. YIM 152468 TaxID=3031759 RepID=UPI0023DBFD06|nr:cbb3-type cytochrome oxidase assembly protein CcoS [Hoeflea sp. YIM 152468]MDF1609322.1 cbb3-type cytochrome oxidase assembly protein CcoS [Hoeflea sp. YIM 152468]
MTISIGLGLIALAAFLWSLHTNQYEGLDGAAVRVLLPNATPVAAGKKLSLQTAINSVFVISNASR